MVVWDIVGPVLLLAVVFFVGWAVWRVVDARAKATVADAEARKWEAMRKNVEDRHD